MSGLQLQLGNETERDVIDFLKAKHYWAYLCPKKQSGAQPFDIFTLKAVKNEGSVYYYFIDAKHVNEKKISFSFDDIQSNQITSFMYARDYAGLDEKNMGFAIKFERTAELLWLGFPHYNQLVKEGRSSVKNIELKPLSDVIK